MKVLYVFFDEKSNYKKYVVLNLKKHSKNHEKICNPKRLMDFFLPAKCFKSDK